MTQQPMVLQQSGKYISSLIVGYCSSEVAPERWANWFEDCCVKWCYMHVCWMWRRILSKNCWIVQRICVILLLMWDDDGMRRLSTRRETNEMMVMMMILLWLMIHETRDDWWLMIIHETIGRVSPGRRYLAILSRYLLEDRRDGPSGPAILVKYRTISRAARDTWNFLDG